LKTSFFQPRDPLPLRTSLGDSGANGVHGIADEVDEMTVDSSSEVDSISSDHHRLIGRSIGHPRLPILIPGALSAEDS